VSATNDNTQVPVRVTTPGSGTDSSTEDTSTIGTDEDSFSDSVTTESDSIEDTTDIEGEDSTEDSAVDASILPEDTQDSSTGEDVGPALPLPAERSCSVAFQVQLPPGTESASIPSSLNQWSLTDWSLADENGDGVWEGEFDVTGVEPGPYPYKLLLNETDWNFDPSNPEKMYSEGVENSKLRVPDCNVPLIVIESLDLNPGNGSITLEAIVHDGLASEGLDVETTGVFVEGDSFPGAFDPETQRFKLTLEDLSPGKHSLVLKAGNASGMALPKYIPFWVEDEAFSWEDATLYFAMVDRFSDAVDGPAAPDCLPTGVNSTWMGGDWKGIEEKIEEGYFTDLGINAIWITSPMNNPDECFPGTIPNELYTAYHGYFPDSYVQVEERHGTMEDLKSMVSAAHNKGIRVIADLVLNHVYETHPLYAESPGWFFPSCLCGSECDWNSFAVECWFESYLPDLDYGYVTPLESVVEVAEYWLREVGLDGYRVDAVKHMHDHLFLSLRSRLEALVADGNSPLYLVGETFTGDWGNGSGEEVLIKSYVNQDMLHGQFDFPLFWQVVRAFARGETSMSALGSTLMESDGYYNGVMSPFLGNHDVPRFISHAAGQIGDLWGNGSKEQGFDNPPTQPAEKAPFESLRLAQSFLYAIPGIPLTYYGDEIGLAGAGDPDNRRMMVFDGWSEEQESTFAHLSELGQLRKGSVALRRGNLQVIWSDEDVLIIQRETNEEVIWVGLNRSQETKSIELSVSAANEPTVLYGPGTVTSSGTGQSLSIPPRSSLFWK